MRPRCRSLEGLLKALAASLLVCFAVLISGTGRAQTAVPAGITISTEAEVETTIAGPGQRSFGLATADHVVAGDQLVYTVGIHNPTSRTLSGVIVTNPIPNRMGYIAGSAQGPGADIDFSVDGGASFAKPEALTIKLAQGRTRPATALDYTHIRWKLKYPLSANSTAFARFRASLK
jgi:uncharacterized repeat protein (TIGR01451 family)